MAEIVLKRGQTVSVAFSVLNAAGTGQLDLDGYTATLVIAGHGRRLQIEGDVDSPSTLGTGSFPFVAGDYSTLLPADYDFEVWLDDGADENIPTLTGTLRVLNVPQRY